MSLLLTLSYCVFVQSCHSVPQWPADSPTVSPESEAGSQPFSATRDEEVETNPRPASPAPSTSSSLSVTSCISAWEQRVAQDSRQGYHSPCTPSRTQSPAAPSASRARRRALCWAREEEEVFCPPPAFDLDQVERSYRVSELALGSKHKVVD